MKNRLSVVLFAEIFQWNHERNMSSNIKFSWTVMKAFPTVGATQINGDTQYSSGQYNLSLNWLLGLQTTKIPNASDYCVQWISLIHGQMDSPHKGTTMRNELSWDFALMWQSFLSLPVQHRDWVSVRHTSLSERYCLLVRETHHLPADLKQNSPFILWRKITGKSPRVVTLSTYLAKHSYWKPVRKPNTFSMTSNESVTLKKTLSWHCRSLSGTVSADLSRPLSDSLVALSDRNQRHLWETNWILIMKSAQDDQLPSGWSRLTCATPRMLRG